MNSLPLPQIYILSISDDTDTESLQLGLVLLAVILGNTLVDFTQRMNAERVILQDLPRRLP